MFRLRARNKFGWSDVSSESQTICTNDETTIELPKSLALCSSRAAGAAANGEIEITEEPIVPNLDYNRENNDVPLISSEPEHLYSFKQGDESRQIFSHLRCIS